MRGGINMRRRMRSQKGAVLPLTIVIMVVGAISVTALFGYLGASLLLVGKNQEKVDAYYSADSGIEYAIAELVDSVAEITAYGSKEFEPFELNGRTVQVTIADEGSGTYTITSTAIGEDGESTIVACALVHDYEFFFDGAINSRADVTIQPGSSVTGNVTYVGTLTGGDQVDGNVTQVDEIEPWPTDEILADFYQDDVPSTSFGSNIIDAAYVNPIGPLYREGQLSIYSTITAANTTLGGTVYVTDQLDIGQVKKEFTLDLGGQTIYCDYRGTGDAIRIGGEVTLTGSGCIIAIGDIQFQPQLTSNPDDYIMVLSVEGTIDLQPNGDFYGCLVGNVEVNLQPGMSVYNDGETPDNLNFLYDTLARPQVLAYNVQ
jgi:hypothetical protein